MPNISAIRERREQFSFDWGMESWKVQYRAGEASTITEAEKEAWNATIKQIGDGGSEDDAKTFLAQLVVRFVAWWDVLDGDAMYTIDAEHVTALDPEFNTALLSALLTDYAQKKMTTTPTPPR